MPPDWTLRKTRQKEAKRPARTSGTNPDNIKLFRDHKDELHELFKKYPMADPS